MIFFIIYIYIYVDKFDTTNKYVDVIQFNK